MSKISEYWDPSGLITYKSDPDEEYDLYCVWLQENEQEDDEDDEEKIEITYKDFLDHIDQLKENWWQYLEKTNGSTFLRNTKVYLTQQAYITGTSECPYYEAHAIDKEGKQYLVQWNLKPGLNLDDIEDESLACNWEKPNSIQLIN